MTMPRLKEKYNKEIIAELQKKFNYKNKNEVPKLVKIVVNMGLGRAVQDPNVINEAVEEMGLIVGQRPVVTKAKKSVSNFKLRENVKIGCMTTLRASKMFEFLDRLINIALPRVRDFRGILPRSFDGRGNYSFGVKDITIFPEINADKIKQTKGMDVTFVTTAETNDEAFELLKLLGLPFRKN